MPAPPNRCIQVALGRSRATCCFDAPQSGFCTAGIRGPSCTFGGMHAQTATFQHPTYHPERVGSCKKFRVVSPYDASNPISAKFDSFRS
jgi:hypothetical protein